jgi:hypothetical protein
MAILTAALCTILLPFDVQPSQEGVWLDVQFFESTPRGIPDVVLGHPDPGIEVCSLAVYARQSETFLCRTRVGDKVWEIAGVVTGTDKEGVSLTIETCWVFSTTREAARRLRTKQDLVLAFGKLRALGGTPSDGDKQAMVAITATKSRPIEVTNRTEATGRSRSPGY